MNARIINVRFNLDKEKHRQAWEALQQLRQEKGWSYSESFSEALVAFMDNKIRDRRTEEEIGRSYAEKIIATTEQMMKLALPAFFTGLAVQGGTVALAQMPSAESEAKPSEEKSKPDTIPDDEIPWDYLGE